MRKLRTARAIAHRPDVAKARTAVIMPGRIYRSGLVAKGTPQAHRFSRHPANDHLPDTRNVQAGSRGRLKICETLVSRVRFSTTRQRHLIRFLQQLIGQRARRTTLDLFGDRVCGSSVSLDPRIFRDVEDRG
jgi:hypothetical protein